MVKDTGKAPESVFALDEVTDSGAERGARRSIIGLASQHEHDFSTRPY